MGLVKNHDSVARHLLAHNLGNLGVQQVVVRVHDNVGLLDSPPKKIYSYSPYEESKLLHTKAGKENFTCNMFYLILIMIFSIFMSITQQGHRSGASNDG